MTTSDAGDWVPDSCTLPTAEQPLRVAEFEQFFAEAVQRADRVDRTRLELWLSAESEARGRDLAAREAACCSFFAFTVESGPGGVVMRIEVPDSRVDVLDALAVRAGAR
ncbi:hypothetical protein JK358_21110 [Nocardia sp. 2]|uniref:Arsenate reductase n=1 Tax=Nocardia acididurans TaxID=2802282 RepID=A0ABS1MCG8_9NOCA|nr:hypothetical protein [Nocardia acididurans]MBL1076898.1 hypothetical protein [Nocardia acididurans]